MSKRIFRGMMAVTLSTLLICVGLFSAILFPYFERQLAGELQMPAPRPFTKAGTTVYEGKVTLTQAIRCTQVPESVKLVFSYQCCDSNICLSPQEDEFEVKFE